MFRCNISRITPRIPVATVLLAIEEYHRAVGGRLGLEVDLGAGIARLSSSAPLGVAGRNRQVETALRGESAGSKPLIPFGIPEWLRKRVVITPSSERQE